MPARRFMLPVFCSFLVWSFPAHSQVETINERANRLELDTEYVPPPGDPNSHYTNG